jgi:predicted metal-dependent hydrolase
MDAGVHQCRLGSDILEYRLRRSARRTLGIAVEPDGAVVVTAPHGVGLDRVEGALRRRRGWIRRRRREALDRPPAPAPREWVGGETHRYLGRQYRLRIRAGAPAVALRGGHFAVSVRSKTPAAVRAAMEQWYLDRAREVFGRRARALIDATPRLRLGEVPPIQVRKLAKRWGSCSPRGRLLLNVDAVKLPVGCVDYLIVHELCHLRVPHHGRGFWRLLDASMPDWERWRKRLAGFEG